MQLSERLCSASNRYRCLLRMCIRCSYVALLLVTMGCSFVGEGTTSTPGPVATIYGEENIAEGSTFDPLLGEVGLAPTPFPEAIGALVQVLRHGSNFERIVASRLVPSKGADAVVAVPALSANLSHEDFEVRDAMADALGRIGAPAIDALPFLVDRLRDTNYKVADSAAWALGQLGSNRAVPALAEALYIGRGNNYNHVARRAAHSIETLTGITFVEPPYQADSMNDDGIPFIVVHAREWWENEGRFQEWLGSVP